MNAHTPLEAIAYPSLEDGSTLWPSRGIYPPGFCERARENDRSTITCEVLAEGAPSPSFAVELRFLHLAPPRPAETVCPVELLRPHRDAPPSRDEAIPRSVRLPVAHGSGEARREVSEVPGGADWASGAQGRLSRRWEPLRIGSIVHVARHHDGLSKLHVSIHNLSTWRGFARSEAERRSLLCAHLVLSVQGGRFLSLSDPPLPAREVAAACRNDGVWPALVGPPETRDTMLASPVVLEDFAVRTSARDAEAGEGVSDEDARAEAWATRAPGASRANTSGGARTPSAHTSSTAPATDRRGSSRRAARRSRTRRE